MPRGVTLLQHLANLEGRPTALAKTAAGVLAASAAAVGFAAGPHDGGTTAPRSTPVPASRLAGELPESLDAQVPALRAAVALPALSDAGRSRRPAQPAVVAAPSPTATPEATATPEPTPDPALAEPVTPVVAPAPPAPKPAPARPQPTPGPTFDSSG